LARAAAESGEKLAALCPATHHAAIAGLVETKTGQLIVRGQSPISWRVAVLWRAFLDFAFELIAPAVYLDQIVVSKLTSLFLDFALVRFQHDDNATTTYLIYFVLSNFILLDRRQHSQTASTILAPYSCRSRRPPPNAVFGCV
jgi:hypothetical protein